MKCPNCESSTQFLIEKSPFGQTECCNCRYKASHMEFNNDILNNEHNFNISDSPLGLKITGKDGDYVSIDINKNKNLCIDGEIKYINTIELNKVELDILIYKLVEYRKRLD